MKSLISCRSFDEVSDRSPSGFAKAKKPEGGRGPEVFGQGAWNARGGGGRGPLRVGFEESVGGSLNDLLIGVA